MEARRRRSSLNQIMVVAIPVLILAAMFVKHVYVGPLMPKRLLPVSASDVQTYYSSAFGGDYTYCLKAKLPKADFPEYAKSLGIKRRFNPVEWPSSALWPFSHRPPPSVPPWFNSPGKDAKIDWYWGQDPDTATYKCLTWKSGFVYYQAISV